MKKLFFISIFICFATLIYGQNEPKTLLWKITKPGSMNESFLFGTFHEVNPSFFDSLTIALAKLKQSDILFVEERASIAKSASLIKQPQWNFKKWSSILTNEQKQIFSDFVKKAEDTSYYNLNPLLLSLTASRLYLTNFCQSTMVSTQLMDHHIEEIAVKQGKLIYSLDTDLQTIIKNAAEKSTSRTDSIYASYGIRYFQNMLNNDISGCKVINDYKKLALNYELDVDIPENSTNSWLLVDRNSKWAVKLHESLLTKNCFIAVGFSHLFYKQGLIQKLRNLGYVVTPVPIEQ